MGIRKVKKSLAEQEVLFNNLLNTVYGSFIYSVLVLRGISEKITHAEFIKYMKRGSYPFMDDPDFLEKTWLEFEKYAKTGKGYIGLPLAVVESPYNTLIVPYMKNNGQTVQIDEETDITPEYILCPLNKEGNYNYTLSFATINNTWRPIEW